jgi:uncharacterized membrane protein
MLDWIRGGRETVRRTGLLLREPLPPDLDGRSPAGAAVTAAQAGVMVAVGSTLADADRRAAREMTAEQRALAAAAGDNVAAWQVLRNAADGSPASRHAAAVDPPQSDRPPDRAGAEPAAGVDNPMHHAARRTRSADHDRPPRRRSGLPDWWRSWRRNRPVPDPVVRRDFDPHQHLISAGKLAVMEVIFLVVEVAFWFGVFTGSIDRSSDTPSDWIPPALLAVFLPLAGIASARIAGQLGHRLVAGYPGVGPREWIGTTVALVAIVAAGWATYGLVYLRFAGAPVGETELPPLFMALIFVIVLMADTVARTFMRSELHDQRSARVAELNKLARQAIAANTVHEQAWLRLRARIQDHLDRCERIAATGAGLITDSLVARSTGVPVWVPVGPDRAAHRLGAGTEPTGANAAGPGDVTGDGRAWLGVPNPDQLHLFGVPLVHVPLRELTDAIDTLDYWRPRTEAAMTAELAQLRQRWFGSPQRYGTPSVAPSGLLVTMAGGGRPGPGGDGSDDHDRESTQSAGDATAHDGRQPPSGPAPRTRSTAPGWTQGSRWPVPRQLHNDHDGQIGAAPAAGPEGDT